MEKFDLFNIPINTFCNIIDGIAITVFHSKRLVPSASVEIIDKELGRLEKKKTRSNRKKLTTAHGQL